MKPSQIGEITLLSSDIGKSCHSRKFTTSQISNAIHENKILVKFSELTVFIGKIEKYLECELVISE